MDLKKIISKKIPTKDGSYLKIMAYSDGYFMCRFKGCVPFVLNENELKARIEERCVDFDLK